MKITEKIFYLPPFISTSWNNVAALYMKETTLIVNLFDGASVEIPELPPELLERIFECHMRFIEQHSSEETARNPLIEAFPLSQIQSGIGNAELPLKFGIGAIDSWGTALEHDPAHASMPNLPDEILNKIRSISKIIAPDDTTIIPKPEPHCNCVHCQISRAINEGIGLLETSCPAEEPVSDADLHFEEWEILQTDHKMYTVTNRLDAAEKYNVYLGHPLGCTCGKQNCEHILAVLKS